MFTGGGVLWQQHWRKKPDKLVRTEEEVKVVNHKTDGEVGKGFSGQVVNHGVLDAVGHPLPAVVNHGMGDAAPKPVHIVNHDLRDCSDPDELARVLGVHRYPGRVLGTTSAADILQLHPDLKNSFDAICCHYDRIGLEHSRDIIWDDGFHLMEDYPELPISVFFFGKRAHSARPDGRWFDTVQDMNSKNIFIEQAEELDIPVPRTFRFKTKEKLGDCKDFNFPVYLKVAISVSGSGVVKCLSAQDLERELGRVDSGLEFQIQEDVGEAVFINLQYHINGHGLERFVATEQVLDGVSHSGNIFPTVHQPWEIVDPIAVDMYRKGMKGFFAFDLAITERRVFAIECNPRWNGSTYPTKIAQKLGVSHWKARSLHTCVRNLSDIDLGELEFDPDKKKGVVLVNWGCVTEGKLGVMIAGRPEVRDGIEERLLDILQ